MDNPSYSIKKIFMKNLVFPLLYILSISLFMACGPTPPSEQELRSMLKGTYCAEDYKLELTDSTYQNRKFIRSPLRSGLMRESCNGTYDLAFEKDQWILRFNKDEQPDNALFMNCESEFVIWSKADEYTISTQPVMLKDLFDGVELKKGACEDL
jgi:hypothetical protein